MVGLAAARAVARAVDKAAATREAAQLEVVQTAMEPRGVARWAAAAMA